MGRIRLREIVVCSAAFAAGSLVGFFGAGPALFADGPMFARLQVLAATMLIYFSLGVAAGALAPHMWKHAGFSLVLPLLPLAALFGGAALSSIPMLLLVVGFLLGDTAAALLGALVGARWGLKHPPAEVEPGQTAVW